MPKDDEYRSNSAGVHIPESEIGKGGCGGVRIISNAKPTETELIEAMAMAMATNKTLSNLYTLYATAAFAALRERGAI